MTRAQQIEVVRAQLAALVTLVDSIATAESAPADDELVNESTAVAERLCGGRGWDRAVAAGRLAVHRAGRRYVARRGDVLALRATARTAVVATAQPEDADARALARKGLRLVGAAGGGR